MEEQRLPSNACQAHVHGPPYTPAVVGRSADPRSSGSIRTTRRRGCHPAGL